jgi:hypothetical protein
MDDNTLCDLFMKAAMAQVDADADADADAILRPTVLQWVRMVQVPKHIRPAFATPSLTLWALCALASVNPSVGYLLYTNVGFMDHVDKTLSSACSTKEACACAAAWLVRALAIHHRSSFVDVVGRGTRIVPGLVRLFLTAASQASSVLAAETLQVLCGCVPSDVRWSPCVATAQAVDLALTDVDGRLWSPYFAEACLRTARACGLTCSLAALAKVLAWAQQHQHADLHAEALHTLCHVLTMLGLHPREIPPQSTMDTIVQCLLQQQLQGPSCQRALQAVGTALQVRGPVAEAVALALQRVDMTLLLQSEDHVVVERALEVLVSSRIYSSIHWVPALVALCGHPVHAVAGRAVGILCCDSMWSHEPDFFQYACGQGLFQALCDALETHVNVLEPTQWMVDALHTLKKLI